MKSVKMKNDPTDDWNNMDMFKGAKFGDRFMTRDGRMAIFISNEDFYFDETGGSHDLWVQQYGMTNYFDNGKQTASWNRNSEYEDVPECELDIVSVWEEKIEKLAHESISETLSKYWTDSDMYCRGFEAGYRKGIENIEYNKL